jgi:hypothetical protein
MVARVGRTAAVVGVLFLCAGCATVAPYERERLADRAMALDPDALLVEVEQHTHEYREGTTGGLGGGGGGCGCN